MPGDAGAALRSQRFSTVKTIAEIAQSRRVDAVLVAGDVFEHNAVADETLRRTINAMAPFTGPWVLLPGNHDSNLTQSVWSRLHSLSVAPQNVIFAVEPKPIYLCDGQLVVLPAPLQRRHEVWDLTEWYDGFRSDERVFRVGLAYGSLTNLLPEAANALNPIADTRASTANLDYLALGDWHGTKEVAHRTWYAGTPEPDRFKANEPGNVLLVELEVGSKPKVDRIPLGKFQWVEKEFELIDDTSISVLDQQIANLENIERTLLRLKLSGSIDLAARHHLSEMLDNQRARLHFLDVDESSLLAQPSQDDIDAMGATGFVQDAIETLVGIESDDSNADRGNASRALQILYHEQRRLQN